MDYIQLGIGTAMIALGVLLWAYIKKIKSKLRRYILRKGGDNEN